MKNIKNLTIILKIIVQVQNQFYSYEKNKRKFVCMT